MTKNVVLKYTVDPTNSQQTVKEMKAEINSLNKSMNDLTIGTDDYYKAVNRLGELKSSISDLNKDINSVSTDRLKAVMEVSNGVASGFQSIYSASQLFFGANKDLEKALVQLTAIQGVISGAKGFTDSLEHWGNLYRSLKVQILGTSSAMKESKAAIDGAATATKGFGLAFKAIGIGLIITAIAALIANWDKVKKAVTDFIPALKNLDGVFDKVMETLYGIGNVIKKVFQGDFNIAANYAEGVADRIQSKLEEAHNAALEASIKAVNNEVEVLKARGRDTYKIERENLKRSLDLYKDNAEEYDKVLQQVRILDATHEKALSDQREKDRQKQEADLKKRNEELQKLEEDRLKVLIDSNTKIISLQESQKLDALNEIIKNGQATTEVESELYSERLGRLSEFSDNKINVSVASAKTVTEAERTEAEAQSTIAYNLYKHRESLLSTTSSLLKGASAIAGESTKTGKILAIASATIDTYQSAVAAFKSMAGIPYVGPALGAAAAAAAIAAGLANIAAIKRTNTNSTSVASTGSISYSAPAVPATAITTQLTSDSLQGISNNVSNNKVYVLESDIRNTGNRVSSYENSSQIG